jgi:hypothetical protein
VSDDPRLVLLADLAHRHAEAVQQRQTSDAEALADLQRQLDAVSAELERLRALPELKVGQRLRQLARVGRNTALPETPRHARTPTSAMSAVLVVRNRTAALDAVLAVLRDAQVDRIEVIDDASTNPSTGAALRDSGVVVRRLAAPLGALGAWATGAMAEHLADGPTLLVTGDAAPSPDCPHDVIDRMRWELDRNRDAQAVELRVDGAERAVDAMFRLHRATGPALDAVVLADPYTARVLHSTPDDPAERFARFHDEP